MITISGTMPLTCQACRQDDTRTLVSCPSCKRMVCFLLQPNDQVPYIRWGCSGKEGKPTTRKSPKIECLLCNAKRHLRKGELLLLNGHVYERLLQGQKP